MQRRTLYCLTGSMLREILMLANPINSMNYQNTLEFALEMAANDPLKDFQSKFLVPEVNGKPVIYLCGNSLGLQPVNAQSVINNQLNNWSNLAIEGFFTGDEPWLDYHKDMTPVLADIVGASADEVTIMNSLTVNLHVVMVSFYKP